MLARHLFFPNWNHSILITNLKNNSTSSNLGSLSNFHSVSSCWSAYQCRLPVFVPLCVLGSPYFSLQTFTSFHQLSYCEHPSSAWNDI